MYISLAINAWAAIAPGIYSNSQWQAWANAPWLPQGEADPDLQAVAPMARRRLSRLGKMAVSVAMATSHDSDQDQLPVVWASRYGDAQRSLGLLAEHVQSEPLSPTAFALSVHNGIGAQYSITQKITQNASSLAAGPDTVEAGMIEAACLLAEGHPEALLVCYDAPLPDSYARFHDSPAAEFAWAARVSHKAQGAHSRRVQLQASSALADTASTSALPPGLDVLRFILSDEARLHRRHRRGSWCWSRVHD